ncbi:threonine/serine exporter family protein [Enterococcus sp. AZ126]|uniref:threonine/serine exporter family protein n=1 Tax=Enterococcus sp. AZ126 TaxID=2774635 RepID=UPI003F253491
MLTQIIFSFLVSGSTSILNNVQKKYFVLCGISGVIAALAYNYFIAHNNAAISSLISCVILSICSQFFAQMTKIPSMVFTISGIMPIVPGSLLFKAFNSLAENNYNQAINFGTQAILVGFSIAIGFLINEVLSSVLLNLKNAVKKI